MRRCATSWPSSSVKRSGGKPTQKRGPDRGDVPHDHEALGSEGGSTRGQLATPAAEAKADMNARCLQLFVPLARLISRTRLPAIWQKATMNLLLWPLAAL